MLHLAIAERPPLSEASGAMPVSKYCTQCHRMVRPDWQWRICNVCQDRHRERTGERTNKLQNVLTMSSQVAHNRPSVSMQKSSMLRPNRGATFLSYHCIFCMNKLTEADTRPNEPPVCRDCSKALQTNPGGLTSVPFLGATAPTLRVTQADPYGHHPKRLSQNPSRDGLRVPIPHFNSRGELISFPGTQAAISPAMPVLPPHYSFQPGLQTTAFNTTVTHRMCLRYGCGTILPPHATDVTCERCVAQNYPPVVSRNVSIRTPTHPIAYPPSKSESSLAGALTETSKKDSDAGSSFSPTGITPAPSVSPAYKPLPPEGFSSGKPEEIVEQTKPVSSNVANGSEPCQIDLQNDVSSSIPISSLPVTTNFESGSRSCKTLGCQSLVPPDTKWPRCTDCSMKRWKSRLQCHHDQAEDPRISAGNSLPKKRKAEDMVDNASDNAEIESRIHEEDRPSLNPEVVESRGDVNEPNANLSNLIPGWDSDLTELSSEEDSSDEGGSEVEDKAPALSGLKIRIPGISSRKLASTSNSQPNSWTGPTRTCVMRGCNSILSPSYRWKLCETCRTQAREYQRHRLGTLKTYTSPTGPAASPLSQPVHLVAAGERICHLKHCRRPLPSLAVYPWKRCEICRSQKLQMNLEGSKTNKRKRARSMSCESEEGMGENGYQSEASKRCSSSPSPEGPDVPVSSHYSALSLVKPSPKSANAESSPPKGLGHHAHQYVNRPPATYPYRLCSNQPCVFLIHVASKFGSCERCRGISSINGPNLESSRAEAGVGQSTVGEEQTGSKSTFASIMPQKVQTAQKGRRSSDISRRHNLSPKQPPSIFTSAAFNVDISTPTPSQISTSSSALKPILTSTTKSESTKPKYKPTYSHLPLRISNPNPAYPSYQQLMPLVDDLGARLDSFFTTYLWWMKVQRLTGTGSGNHHVEPMKSAVGPAQKDSADKEQNKKGKEQEQSSCDSNDSGTLDKTPMAVEAGDAFDSAGDIVESPAAPVAFGFEGEYSIVAPGENVAGKMGTEQTWGRVAKVVREIQRRTGLKFSTKSSFMIKSGGTILRFRCLHQVSIPLSSASAASSPNISNPTLGSLADPKAAPIPQPTSSQTPTPMKLKNSLLTSSDTNTETIMKMAGELEIAVVPDLSHRFFVGQRTIVRFRLVGQKPLPC